MKHNSEIEITVSNRTILRVIGIILGSYLALRFISNISHVLQLIFVAFFLALALNPAVSWIARKLNLKRRVTATGIAYLAVVIVLSTLFMLVVPPLISQTVDFVRDAPNTISSLKDESTWAGKIVSRYNLESQVDGLAEDITERTKDIRQPVVATAGRVGSALISIITVFVLTFMMLVEGPAWMSRIFNLQPHGKRERYKKLASQMYGVVSGYVNGQVLLALIGASFNFTALVIASTLLDVSVNAVALAGIIVVAGLIPMIGHIIGTFFVVLACLFVSVPLAIFMFIFMLFYQQVENVTLQPYIQAKYNEMTPLLVFIAALVGVGFGGLIGAFVAIPAAGCIKVLFIDYMARRRLTKQAS